MYSNQKPEGNLYPEVIITNPETPTSSSSLYPTIDTMEGISNNLFPYHDDTVCGSPNGQIPVEQLLVTIPGAIVHLIDNQRSVELACGELNVVCLKQGSNTVAVLARVGDEIQWPLAKDEGVVKLDSAHYFFTLRIPGEEESRRDSESLLNYGLTVASRGQERVLKELDSVLEKYSAFSVQKVRWKGNWEVLNGKLAKETSPQELEKDEKKKEAMGENSAAYWTTLAPNVEDYSGCVARMIASGSGQLIRGIIWCGDVTVDRLKWGEEFLSKRMGPSSNSEISPQAVKRMKSVKRVTKMSEKVASGVLTGVVKVSGFFTSSIVNSKVGKKFFSLLPGEIVLASLDGFNKVFDAVEVAGKNVMSTSSTVTTGLVSQRYGEQAAEVTDEGLGAAGHAIGTAWAVFKMRKALNPKSVFKPTTLAKAAAKANSDELKAKYSK